MERIKRGSKREKIKRRWTTCCSPTWAAASSSSSSSCISESNLVLQALFKNLLHRCKFFHLKTSSRSVLSSEPCSTGTTPSVSSVSSSLFTSSSSTWNIQVQSNNKIASVFCSTFFFFHTSKLQPSLLLASWFAHMPSWAFGIIKFAFFQSFWWFSTWSKTFHIFYHFCCYRLIF